LVVVFLNGRLLYFARPAQWLLFPFKERNLTQVTSRKLESTQRVRVEGDEGWNCGQESVTA